MLVQDLFQWITLDEDVEFVEFPLDFYIDENEKSSVYVRLIEDYPITESNSLELLLLTSIDNGIVELLDDITLPGTAKARHRLKAGLHSHARYRPDILIYDTRIKHLPTLPKTATLIPLDSHLPIRDEKSPYAYLNIDESEFALMIMMSKDVQCVVPYYENKKGHAVLNTKGITIFKVRLC